MGEVIQGPWGKNFFDEYCPQDVEDITDLVAQSVTEEVFEMLREAGFDHLEDPLHYKDLALINEAIRSHLMSLQERYHPLQDVAGQFFNIEADGSLSIQNSVDVEFRNEI